MRFKNILFVAGQNLAGKDSLLKAVEFTKAHKTRLTVVLPIGTLITDRPFGWANVIYERWEHCYIDEQVHRLRRYTNDVNGKNTRLHHRTLAGTPHVEIAKLVLTARHGVVIKEGGSTSSVSDKAFDPLDRQLIRSCPCPVWIIRPHRRRKGKRILAAIDPSTEGDPSNKLAIKIIDTAAHFADLWNGEVHVVHAWRIRGESLLRAGAFPTAATDQIDALVKDTEIHHRNLVENALRRSKRQHAGSKIHLVKGVASEQIWAMAEKLRTELLVMGTLGRTGIAGKIIGNTAERVLEGVSCSIMALKPPGYVSPVRQ